MRCAESRVTYGELLRSDRKNSGLSQRELAKKVGVDFTYISKIENGKLEPSLATAGVIAMLLQVGFESHATALGWHRCPACDHMHRMRPKVPPR